MLETRKLTKDFKGLRAVSNLDLTIHAQEIVGIIGPNGAGKTTTFDLITGFLQPTSGNIIFEGEDITGQKPHMIAKSGIVRTFQLDRIYHNFTVLQNVVVASHLYARISFWEAVLNTSTYNKKDKNTWDRSREILEFVGLYDKKDEIARNLSHGHQKTLGIAVALAANPKLLLLDEPLAGMNPTEVARALEIISEIRGRGIVVLLIEHNMRAVMSICDRIVVLNFGTEIARGSPEELKQNEEVIRAYLGAGEYAA
ncbi:MAG TPA: ABC transporter ATP-binding protein [Dehalococcoidia bacterium]|nr:ABC transporter ATP-binding protein [Dehalococcoidia bacterium]